MTCRHDLTAWARRHDLTAWARRHDLAAWARRHGPGGMDLAAWRLLVSLVMLGPHDHNHGADTGWGHAHAHAPANFNRAFAIAVALNAALILAQVICGIIANSVALLADAGHNFADVLGLLLAW